MKTESSAVNTYNGMFGQQGWICPKYEVVLDNGCPAESMRIANEWADDTHVLGLTKKGMKLYLQEED